MDDFAQLLADKRKQEEAEEKRKQDEAKAKRKQEIDDETNDLIKKYKIDKLPLLEDDTDIDIKGIKEEKRKKDEDYKKYIENEARNIAKQQYDILYGPNESSNDYYKYDNHFNENRDKFIQMAEEKLKNTPDSEFDAASASEKGTQLQKDFDKTLQNNIAAFKSKWYNSDRSDALAKEMNQGNTEEEFDDLYALSDKELLSLIDAYRQENNRNAVEFLKDMASLKNIPVDDYYSYTGKKYIFDVFDNNGNKVHSNVKMTIPEKQDAEERNPDLVYMQQKIDQEDQEEYDAMQKEENFEELFKKYGKSFDEAHIRVYLNDHVVSDYDLQQQLKQLMHATDEKDKIKRDMLIDIAKMRRIKTDDPELHKELYGNYFADEHELFNDSPYKNQYLTNTDAEIKKDTNKLRTAGAIGLEKLKNVGSNVVTGVKNIGNDIKDRIVKNKSTKHESESFVLPNGDISVVIVEYEVIEYDDGSIEKRPIRIINE